MPRPDGAVEFRVWAPRAKESVAIRLGARRGGARGGGRTGARDQPLEEVGYGIYAATLEAAPGDDYYVVLDGRRRPDPCSRHQPTSVASPNVHTIRMPVPFSGSASSLGKIGTGTRKMGVTARLPKSGR